ncbi:exo-alpha-sialidase [Brachyspira pilosicoli]|uniref:sialidase family protein n=1 Tax=Brachyspira pilosicoli TaxID=52584 RepID=UPI0012F4EB7A|nr:sialidase family protein [Brachyspira pilosicoli]MBW5378561.1 exo-alpha-sialidase [Brachyspira pilosicoli]
MSKLKLFLILASSLLISCVNPNDPEDTGTGGTGTGGGITEGGYILPKGSLTQEEQKQILDPNKSTTPLFVKGNYDSKFFRIPALITTRNGVVLAATDRRYDKTDDLGKTSKIDVIVRRSTDLGNTWSEPILVGPGAKDIGGSDAYGDAFFINCHNGDVILGYIQNPGWQGAATSKLFRSSDDGQTWREIYSFGMNAFDGFDIGKDDSTGKPYTVSKAFAASGQGLTLRHGANAGQKRLMFAMLASTTGGLRVLTMVSEDDGTTWTPKGKSVVNANFDETKVIELSDGRIMLNHRKSVSTGGRAWSLGASYAATDYTSQGDDPEIIDPGNNGDLVRYEFDGVPILKGGEKYALLIHANSPKTGLWFTARFNHHVKFTKNDFGNGNGAISGKYDYNKQLVNGGDKLYSGYPTITVLPDGTIGTLTEETSVNAQDQYDIIWRRFNLYWLSDQKEFVDYSTGPRFQQAIK